MKTNTEREYSVLDTRSTLHLLTGGALGSGKVHVVVSEKHIGLGRGTFKCTTGGVLFHEEFQGYSSYVTQLAAPCSAVGLTSGEVERPAPKHHHS